MSEKRRKEQVIKTRYTEEILKMDTVGSSTSVIVWCLLARVFLFKNTIKNLMNEKEKYIY